LAFVVAIYVVLQPNIYRAEVFLAPNLDADSGGLSGLVAQYGGLAGLAGVQLGSGSRDKTQLGLSILRSRKFISVFIKNRGILVPLMAAKSWDENSGEVIIDSDVFDTARGEWLRPIRPPRGVVPSEQEAYEEFLTILRIRRDAETGFVRISLEHVSPVLAQQWVEWLVADLNMVAKEWDVSEASQALEFLNAQLQQISLSGLREVFFRLVEDQTKTIMLANISSEYLLRTIDPAVVPEGKVGPFRTLIVLLALFLGAVAGTVVQVSRFYFRRFGKD